MIKVSQKTNFPQEISSIFNDDKGSRSGKTNGNYEIHTWIDLKSVNEREFTTNVCILTK